MQGQRLPPCKGCRGLHFRGAQLGGTEAVVLGKGGIHTPCGTKTAGLSHLSHGPVGIVQPLLGQQQALGLQVLPG